VVVIAIGKTIAWRRASGAPVHEVEDLSEGERK